MEEIRVTLKKIVADILDFDFDGEGAAFSEQLKPGDLEDWDSLAQINILTQVENTFQIKFTMEEVLTLASVGDILQAIGEKRKG